MHDSNQKNTELLNAIRACNVLKVKELINEGVDVNQFDMANDDYTPLMLAIKLKSADIVDILLKANANLYDSTYFEEIPLGLAAINGDLKITKLLLDAGANPDKGGESPPLCDAIHGEHINVAKTLIKRNADVNACDPSGVTALMIAAITGNMEIVEILLEEGANPDATDKYGNLALDKAAYYGHQEVFDYLSLFTSDLEQREYLQKKLATGILRKQRIEQRKNK